MNGIPTPTVDIQWATDAPDAPDESDLQRWALAAAEAAGTAKGLEWNLGPADKASIEKAGVAADALIDSVDLAVVEWAGLSSDELLECTRTNGFRFMHPFQMLNVTENVRWADEVAGDYVLSGRAPDGSSTLCSFTGWLPAWVKKGASMTFGLAGDGSGNIAR